MNEQNNFELMPDRPLECSECKKNITVRYTEIVGDVITHTSMCSDCPELQRRLYGDTDHSLSSVTTNVNAELVCGNCGTTLEDVRRGHLLGCSQCYEVFEDVLPIEMKAIHCLPTRVFPEKKGVPIHIGRTPGETIVINHSSRLLALNEALKEMLISENYEQAALLRDQIKTLTQTTESKPAGEHE